MKAELPEQRIASADAPSCSRDTTGVCGERGEGRETDRLGIEQTSVAMSRHVAGDTDGRNSVGRRSFDCLQSPPRPSLAHRRRTRLAAAHGELYGFPSRAGVFAAFSMPGENRFRIFGAVPPRPEGPSAKYSEPTHEEFQTLLDERLPLPAKVVKE